MRFFLRETEFGKIPVESSLLFRINVDNLEDYARPPANLKYFTKEVYFTHLIYFE